MYRKAVIVGLGALVLSAFVIAQTNSFDTLIQTLQGLLMFSYLLLFPTAGSDGRLHAHEVFGLLLRADLVVLSACETFTRCTGRRSSWWGIGGEGHCQGRTFAKRVSSAYPYTLVPSAPFFDQLAGDHEPMVGLKSVRYGEPAFVVPLPAPLSGFRAPGLSSSFAHGLVLRALGHCTAWVPAIAFACQVRFPTRPFDRVQRLALVPWAAGVLRWAGR